MDAETGWTQRGGGVEKRRLAARVTALGWGGGVSRAEQSRSTHLDISRVQQQISERSVVFGGEDVVLGVNDVQTQRAELINLHRLPPVLPGLQKVPAQEKVSFYNIFKTRLD